MASRNLPVKDMTVGAYFRAVTLFHLALIAGQLLFAFVLAFRAHAQQSRVQLFENPWFFIDLGVAFAAIAGGHFLYRSRVSRACAQHTLAEKLSAYRGAVVTRDVFPNAVATLSTAAYFVTRNADFLAVSGMILLVFVLWWPYKARAKADLGLEGTSLLDDPDAVIGGS
jgi:hypothetical protein